MTGQAGAGWQVGRDGGPGNACYLAGDAGLRLLALADARDGGTLV